MYGAILGDIIGSRFEFDRGGKTKEFDLFTEESCWTDDTAMTVAVADALLKEGPDATVEKIEGHVRHSLRKWARKYPDAGYGGRFYHWLHTRGAGPYNSYGNGSAMRVSAAGWLYDSLERTREVARATAAVTHNHPEGIKGAECTAAVIYMGRTGSAKDEIREYVSREFGYDLSESLDELRERHEHVESCQDSMPKALVSFFEGESFEDVVRNAVSLGGDTDTLGAIAGAMAEGFYGIPIYLEIECQDRIPEDMRKVLERFTEVVRKDLKQENPALADNVYIEKAIELFNYMQNRESLSTVLTVLQKRIMDDGECLVGFDIVEGDMGSKVLSQKIGETFQLEEDVRLRVKKLTDQNGEHPVYYMLTGNSQATGAPVILNLGIKNMLQMTLDDESVEELVINPFGMYLRLTKDIIRIILKTDNDQNEEGVE